MTVAVADADQVVLAGADIQKEFIPGSPVLREIGIEVERGTVRALIGANGAGKSSLIKILTGVYTPDGSATITIGGRRFHGGISTGEAITAGLRVVHQEAPLIDTLSVMECVALFRGFDGARLGLVNWKSLRRQTNQLFERWDVPVRPDEITGALSPAERSMVSLAIALDDQSGSKPVAFIADEATASLTDRDARRLLGVMRRAADEGLGVLMTTHRLGEVVEFADFVTVLNHGSVTVDEPIAGWDVATLAEAMLPEERRVEEQDTNAARAIRSATGRASESPEPGSGLSVTDLAGERLVSLSLSIAPGEIVGLAGLSGSGIDEVPRMLGGSQPRTSGTISVDGATIRQGLGPRGSIREGLVVVPRDRLRDGGIPEMSVTDNVVLPQGVGLVVRPKAERRVLDLLIKTLDVRPTDPTVPFGSLSGGNQQKAIVGKWLLMAPKVLVLAEPTAGVDPGARKVIHQGMKDTAATGVAVLILSAEVEELCALAHRIVILRDGRVHGEVSGDTPASEVAVLTYG